MIWVDWFKKFERVSVKSRRYTPCLQQQVRNVVLKAAHLVQSLSYHRSQLGTDGRDTVYMHQRAPCSLPLSTIPCWLIRITMETYAT
ncbi:hypothetical protein CY34DRAFT_354267 [Suillus luteus UH-Slu-Lm8-n1]|uniref:Uncharacterized protein n=1 Tax=Suillus luteus UH-Slu-Lm8-n1 TaxID=930992 RepID=A0A0D0BLP7_9AGAM|nr:hypothetical protein CY34DRAFT_354267 [Suillus luteus UH-Slu-Lm8-n1]